MIFVYPVGVPAFFLTMLLKYRRKFNDPGVRLQLGFLYDGFGATTWWFELADMLHKLILTSLLAFLPLVYQMPCGMFVAVSYLGLILLAKPDYRKGDDRLRMFSQVEIFLLMLAGFVSLKGEKLDKAGDILLSVAMILVFIGFICIFILQTVNIVRKQWDRVRTAWEEFRVKTGRAPKPLVTTEPTTSPASVPSPAVDPTPTIASRTVLTPRERGAHPDEDTSDVMLSRNPIFAARVKKAIERQQISSPSGVRADSSPEPVSPLQLTEQATDQPAEGQSFEGEGEEEIPPVQVEEDLTIH